MIGESSTALRSVSLTGSLVSVIASGPETARTGDLQMTLSILITNLKGGCGKTTIATNLAAAFARSGFVTAIADLDRQKSSKGWTERRPDTLAPVHAMDWSQEIGPLPTGIERLILDAPAALKRKQLEEMVAAADMVMVPVVPGAFDEQATRRFIRRLDQFKAIARGKKPVAIIANRFRAQTQAAARLDLFLSGLGHQTIARLRDTQLYNQAIVNGLGVFDLTSARAASYQAEWTPILRFAEAG